MANQIPWDILSKHFSEGRLTEEEGEILKKWLNEDKLNLQIFKEAKDVSELTNRKPTVFTPDKKQAWQNITRRIDHKRISYLKIVLQSAAAIFLIMLGVGLKWKIDKANTASQYTTVYAPQGQKCEVLLPDSSYVWLAAGSSITYSNVFAGTERHVNVLGEAYFDVNHVQESSFFVHVNDIKVKVHGTTFNVKAYDDDTFVEVALHEGKVSVMRNETTLALLKPGEVICYNKVSKEFNLKSIDVGIVSAWKNNVLIIDRQPVEALVQYLERWYGVKIEVANTELPDYLYTFRIKTETLNELMELIKVLTPLKYQIEGDKVNIEFINKK